MEVEKAAGEVEDVPAKMFLQGGGHALQGILEPQGAFPPLLPPLVNQDGDDGVFPLPVNASLVIEGLLEEFIGLIRLVLQKKNDAGPFLGIFQPHRKHQVSLFGASLGIHKNRRLGFEALPVEKAELCRGEYQAENIQGKFFVGVDVLEDTVVDVGTLGGRLLGHG